MDLVSYAEAELRRAGLFDSDADYDGALGPAVLDLVRTFSTQGHSGNSAMTAIALFERVIRFRPLTPLTFGPDEWVEVGEDLWQNRRDPTYFTEDNGTSVYWINPVGERTWVKGP